MKEDLIKDLNKEKQYTLDKFPKIENLNNLTKKDKEIIYECIKNVVDNNDFLRGNSKKIATRKKNIENNVYRKLDSDKNNNKKNYLLKGRYAKDILIQKLKNTLLDDKNTLGNIINFTKTYGQVKDNKEKFVSYCKDIAKKIDFQYGHNSKEESKDNSYIDSIKFEEISEDLPNDYNRKEYDTSDIKIKKEIFFHYILKEIRKKYFKYINLFIISYHINKNIIYRNKVFAPTNMDRLFKKKIYYLINTIDDRRSVINEKEEIEKDIDIVYSKEDIKYILEKLCLRPIKGHKKDNDILVADKIIEEIYKKTDKEKKEILKEKLKGYLLSKIFKNSIEKEKKLKAILDPLSFWEYFYEDFKNEIEKTTYYSLLPKVNQRADRRKEKMSEILDDICNTLEDYKYEFDSEDDKEVIIELDDMMKRNIIEFIKLSIPDKNIRKNKEKGKARQKTTGKNLKEHKIKKCDGYKEDIGHYIIDDNILTEEAKEDLQQHLIHCDNCLKYLNDLQSGNKYLNEEIEKGKSFQYSKKYDVIEPIKTLTHNEEIIEFSIEEFNKEQNNYTYEYLILAYIKTGNIKKAKEFYNKSMEQIYKIINNKEVKNG